MHQTVPGRIKSLDSAGWLGVLGIIVLFIALRWNNYDVPLMRDEGEYAYAARLLTHGLAPYEHSFLQKPPMVVYSYALASLIDPDASWSPRLLAGLCAGLATVLLGFIARREFGPGVALPAMWLMTPMVLLPELPQCVANTEMFMVLPLMATVAIFVHSRRSGDEALHWLAAGFFGVVTLCYKYTALPVLAMLFAVWSIEKWRARCGISRLCGLWLSAFLGCLLASVLVLAYFLIHDGGWHLWECTVRFNRFYAATATFGIDGLWENLKKFLWAWWILFLLPLALVFSRPKHLWYWLVLFLAAWISTSASHYGQYYIILMPFWALIVAVAIKSVAEMLAKKTSKPSAWLVHGLTAITVAIVCWPDVQWITRSRHQFLIDKGGDGLVGPVVAARRAAELTSPNDYVFVGGSEPQILFYSHRLSPTRFVITFPIMLPNSLGQAYQAEAIRDLQAHPPKVIVLMRIARSWVRQPESSMRIFDYMWKMLQDDYEPVGAYVPDDKAGHWQEPMSQADFANSTLVLFKRKAPPR